MAVAKQLGIKGLSDEDLELFKEVAADHGLSYAQVVSAGLRLLEASYAEGEDEEADPSREDCEVVRKTLRGVSDTVCDVLRGYAAKAAAEADEARREAGESVEAARAAADGLAAAKAESDAKAARLERENGERERDARGLECALGDRDKRLRSLEAELAEARAAKSEAERKLLASVDAEREAVAEAAELRERIARLEGKLEVLDRGREPGDDDAAGEDGGSRGDAAGDDAGAAGPGQLVFPWAVGGEG